MVLWLLLGTFSMVAMLWTAARKTVVISARSQEQGELVPEYRTEQTGEMQLPMQTDQKADRQICIPLESGTKAENVVVENHYMEKELWIYIENGRKAFYKERRITGDLNPVEKGICEAQNEGVLLRLSMREVLEYHSTLEEGSLWVDYVSPKELYDRIVVLDPVGGGRDPGVTASDCQEKEVALSVARQTAQLMEDRQDASVYGISGEYNDEYYIPEFGNLQWADCVTRQVTVAASNRAVGLFPATEEDVLWEIAIPSARISLGYVTNAAERQLLIQEDYQKKLAQGIAEAINEVYTNTQ